MKLFKIKGNQLTDISTTSFKLEKDIQTLIENNLESVFGIQFVKTELTIKSFRIDSLAFDKENKSFVIIEYKKDLKFSIIDQGYTYLSLLLNNKSDFILEYNETLNTQLKRDDVDWSQSKVIFISPSFSDYQKHSVNFKDVPFELWEIKKFENDLISLTQHKVSSNESISTTIEDNETVVGKVSREVKLYTEEYHLEKKNLTNDIKERYYNLRERITTLNDVEIIPRQLYIGFKLKSNFVDVEIRPKDIKLYINMKIGELDDPKGISRDVSNQGHWGNGDYEIRITENTDLDYIMFLINQSYNKQLNKK
jgi:predicted transport protein